MATPAWPGTYMKMILEHTPSLPSMCQPSDSQPFLILVRTAMESMAMMMLLHLRLEFPLTTSMPVWLPSAPSWCYWCALCVSLMLQPASHHPGRPQNSIPLVVGRLCGNAHICNTSHLFDGCVWHLYQSAHWQWSGFRVHSASLASVWWSRNILAASKDLWMLDFLDK